VGQGRCVVVCSCPHAITCDVIISRGIEYEVMMKSEIVLILPRDCAVFLILRTSSMSCDAHHNARSSPSRSYPGRSKSGLVIQRAFSGLIRPHPPKLQTSRFSTQPHKILSNLILSITFISLHTTPAPPHTHLLLLPLLLPHLHPPQLLSPLQFQLICPRKTAFTPDMLLASHRVV
jgi:hypothetical protein